MRGGSQEGVSRGFLRDEPHGMVAGDLEAVRPTGRPVRTLKMQPLRVSSWRSAGVRASEVRLTAFGNWLDVGRGQEEEGGSRACPQVPGLGAGGSYLWRQGR